MKTNIDTIKEALIKLRSFAKSLDCDYQDKCTQGDDDICQSCKHVYIADDALATLSTIEADAKPQEPSDSVLELVEDIQGTGHDSASCHMISAKKAAALITAHDDAIIRECAERAWDWFCGKSKEDNFPAKKELLTAAILGKEAEK